MITQNNFQTVEIDTTLGMLYFGTYTSPGQIVRFATSNMTNMGMVFAPNVNNYVASCSDATYAYFATYTAPGQITRLNKATFSIVDVLTLGSNAIYPQAASIDVAAQVAYFGTYQNPGRVAIVDLVTFTHNNRTLTLPQNAGLIYTSSITDSGDVYFGTGDSPGIVARLDPTPTAAPTIAPTTAPTQRPSRSPTAVSITIKICPPTPRPTYPSACKNINAGSSLS